MNKTGFKNIQTELANVTRIGNETHSRRNKDTTVKSIVTQENNVLYYVTANKCCTQQQLECVLMLHAAVANKRLSI
jgi:hypothetical protein